MESAQKSEKESCSQRGSKLLKGPHTTDSGLNTQAQDSQGTPNSKNPSQSDSNIHGITVAFFDSAG